MPVSAFSHSSFSQRISWSLLLEGTGNKSLVGCCFAIKEFMDCLDQSQWIS